MVEKIKKGKKRWIKIVGPAEFNGVSLGESYVIDPEVLKGKNVKSNLSNLIGDMRRQNVLVGFKIKEIRGNEAIADIVSYEMIQAHVKRLVRVGQDKIDDSFVVETNDKRKLKIKPIITTRGKANNSILTRIRMETREKMKESAIKEDFKKLFGDIISGYLQKSLKQELRKIYPLSTMDIRKVELLNR